MVFLTDAGARKAFRYLLIGASFLILTMCLWRLWSSSEVAGLFLQNRFYYPVSYPNNAAALFLVGFWPLMWLAAGPEENAVVRGVSLGLATGLLGLAVLTQSRGAIWSLALTVVLAFVVSPARLRTLLYLMVPGLLLIYEFPALDRYWLEGPGAVGGGLGSTNAPRGFGGSCPRRDDPRYLGAVDTRERKGEDRSRRRPPGSCGRRRHLWVDGSYQRRRRALQMAVPDLEQFSGQISPNESEAAPSTRFALVSSSGRVDIWRVALDEFRAAPVLGVGADNFVFQYDRLRELDSIRPRHAHSIELQVLGETGFVGGILAFGGMLLALGGIMWPRCTAGWRGARETWLRRRRSTSPSEANPRICNPRWGSDSMAYGWEMALLVGVAYWLIHASVDWLWQMAGVGHPDAAALGCGSGKCGRARRHHVAALASLAEKRLLLFRDGRRSRWGAVHGYCAPTRHRRSGISRPHGDPVSRGHHGRWTPLPFAAVSDVGFGSCQDRRGTGSGARRIRRLVPAGRSRSACDAGTHLYTKRQRPRLPRRIPTGRGQCSTTSLSASRVTRTPSPRSQQIGPFGIRPG